ncbi:unnamed protein product [Didymodactylos carnosus]|uniref:Uncharacterized protein n=1 Tax=Didymodactylos carnosus TaxID=1234261 RepID=A0A8S2EFI0_9BILA|nr:unnamed protein product [Didymodactylos carnosus]CAF3980201.1 unnamed protein product [Didymodactylos carnosus]
MATQRTPRARKENKPYTPETAALPDHYLIYFPQTNEAKIVPKTLVKLLNGKQAQVKLQGHVHDGIINYAGTIEACQKHYNSQVSSSLQIVQSPVLGSRILRDTQNVEGHGRVEDDDDEEIKSAQRLHSDMGGATAATSPETYSLFACQQDDDDEEVEDIRRPKNHQKRHRITLAALEEEEDEYLANEDTRKRTVIRGIRNSGRRLPDLLSTSPYSNRVASPVSQSALDRLSGSISAQFQTFSKQLVILTKNTKELASVNKQKNEFEIDNDANYPNGLIYQTEDGDVNLLTLNGANGPADFGRQVLKVFFTDKELAQDLMPPPSRRNHTDRQLLDDYKIAILKDAIKYKFKISENSFDGYYTNVLINSFRDLLSNTRKRLKKSGELV